jgi:5-methyltetrahydropteroyltriglutamate--homocysteine methyltransferase
MTRAAIDEQTRAGLDVLTDGQVRWYDPISHLLRGAKNVQIGGLLRLFDTNFYFRQPSFKGPLAWEKPVTVDDWKAASKMSKKPVKPVLTGPFTLAAHSLNADLSQVAAFVAAEVGALAKAGAQTIQIDEPSILKAPAAFGAFAEAVKTVVGKKGKAQIILATWWGDAAPLVGKLSELPVDGLAFDFTYSTALADALAFAAPATTLQLGLVDGRNTRLEKAKDVAKIAAKIAKKAKGDVTLAPSCGLEYLPRDRAFDKLKILADAKKVLK